MSHNIRKSLVVCFSPSGTTRHLARVIEDTLRIAEVPAVLVDLGRDEDIPFILSQMLDAKDNICIYIGSPVYGSYAVPPVMDFIASLPASRTGFSVPFVTWGGVQTGRALYDMSKTLLERGYPVLGAGQFLAEHSLMWMLDDPLEKGHPDREDENLARELVTTVNAKLSNPVPATLPPNLLAPDPGHVPVPDPEGFTRHKRHYPARMVNAERCTQCALCAEQCPVNAIQMSPWPEFGGECVYCLTCVRQCPESAIRVDLEPLFARVKEKLAQSREPAKSSLFL